jgi:hypothetical protein|tara:strand:- start:4434 stop:4997 length:564 start_codon:yes stop_codon:yes gene_type:complete
MILDITEEELSKCYKNRQERYKDMSKSVSVDMKSESKELKDTLLPSLSTISHIFYLRNGWKSYFDIDVIKKNDQEDFSEMEDMLREANFEDIDISTDKGYDKYLHELGVHNWRYVIKHFDIDDILALDRPLIFRQLLNYWGDNYDIDAWLNVKEYYAECESDYSYNLFLQYSEELGFIDAEFDDMEL